MGSTGIGRESLRVRIRRGIFGIGFLIGMGAPAEAWWIPAFPANGAKGDTLWRDTSAPGAPRIPRLAIVGGGVYLANGKTLLIWHDYYRGGPDMRFTPDPAGQSYPFQAPAPLAIDLDRDRTFAIWGNWQSPDLGKTWNPLPFPSTRFRSYIVRSGICLAGGAGETIERSVDAGRTWKTVHEGAGTGFVKEFAFPDSGLFREAGWVFAIAYPSRILFSKDKGLTWKEWPIPDSLGLAGSRIQGIGFSVGWGPPDGRLPTRKLWTLHLDATTGRSRLLGQWIDSGRAEIVTQGLPDTLTCLSAEGRVFTGGGRDLYLVDYDGLVRRPYTLEQLPPGEVLLELHGDGSDFGSFALTRNLYYGSAYEGLIAPRADRAGTHASARGPLGRFLAPAGDGRVLSFLVNGRRLPLSTLP